LPSRISLVGPLPSNTDISVQRPTASIYLSSKESISKVVPRKGEHRSAMSKLDRLPFNMARPDEKWAFSPADRVRIAAKLQLLDGVAMD